jgi:hypothetical protein
MLWEITDTLPSPILRDFHFFLGTLSDNPSPLTPSLNLARKTLFFLNGKMSWQAAEVTEKSDQPLYPLLNLFYHLSLESDLFRLNAEAKTPFFEPNLEKIRQFRAMPPAAQYFFLLETYLQHCDVESLDPNRHFGLPFQLLQQLPLLALTKPGEVVKVRGNHNNPFSELAWTLGYHGLYFEYFGLWQTELEPRGKEWSKTWVKFESLALTSFGKFFLETLFGKKAFQTGDDDGEEYFLMDETRLFCLTGRLHEYFSDSFPAQTFSNVLPVAEETVFRDGVYVFKVSLHYQPGMWRKVALAARHTLQDLHFIIQEAFEFDDDHLYSFYLHPKNDRRDVYHHPEFEPPYADEAVIGDLGLTPGRKFRYLFDFGDSWMFDIVLEEIREGEKALKEPKVLEKHGKAPEQYPDWE